MTQIQPKCPVPGCTGTKFEAVLSRPHLVTGQQVDLAGLSLLCCAECGAVVGVFDRLGLTKH